MITISIVTYKTDTEELAKCLASLNSNLVDNIYIVDNSSEKIMADFCAKQNKVIYIPSDNVGYGSGHNKAIRLALKTKAKYHLVLNSDVYFDPDVLKCLSDYMDNNKDVAQVQPNILYPNGKMQYSCRLLPTPMDLIFRRFMPKSMAKKLNYRYTLEFCDHKNEFNVPYHQGSFMLFRIDCLREVGLFDERFFMYPEDIDITRRMHRKYKTMFVPQATVIHAHRAASYKSKKMLKIHIINMIRYFNKWGWIFDKERKTWNQQLLNQLGYKQNKQ